MTEAKFENRGSKYLFNWPAYSLQAEVSRISVNHETTRCLLVFTSSHPESNPHILQTRFNLESARTRSELAKEMSMRYKIKEPIDWKNLIEYLSIKAIREYEKGEPIVRISSEDETQPLEYLIYPIAPLNKPTVIFGEPGAGKALDDETPIFTIQGWKRHGDLVAGDYVFGADGQPKRIIATRRNEPDRPACLITFDNGEQLIADEAHEWIVECDRIQYRGPRIAHTNAFKRHIEILETKDLLKEQRRAPAIKLTQPLQFPFRLLPIDPYVLGCWLGDGSIKDGYIASGSEDINHFKQIGMARERRPGYWTIRVPGLHKSLRLLGILNEKHIPKTYFLASFAQRLSLLQGIMDTDGYIDKFGRCELMTIKEDLAHDYHRLIISLGLKANIRESDAKLYGRVVSKRYRFSINPLDFPLFTLTRKAIRQKTLRRKTANYRYIKSVVPTSSRPMQCIEVEGGIYVVGEDLIATHNSQLAIVLNIVMALPWGGNPLRLTAPLRPMKALFLDYEADEEDIRRQLVSLSKGMGLPTVELNYRRCSLPLTTDIEAIRSHVEEVEAECLLIDSMSLAAGGDLNRMDVATAYFRALRSLKGMTSISFAHTSKEKEAKTKTIIGSMLWEAGARSVFEIRGDEDEDTLNIGLFHRKANLSKKSQPLGYQLAYKNDLPVNIQWFNPKSIPEFLERMDTTARIIELLKSRYLTDEKIAEQLKIKLPNCRTALSRLKTKGLTYKKDDLWGLVQQPSF